MSVGGNETSSRGHIFCEELQGEGTAGTREVVVLYIQYSSYVHTALQTDLLTRATNVPKKSWVIIFKLASINA